MRGQRKAKHFSAQHAQAFWRTNKTQQQQQQQGRCLGSCCSSAACGYLANHLTSINLAIAYRQLCSRPAGPAVSPLSPTSWFSGTISIQVILILQQHSNITESLNKLEIESLSFACQKIRNTIRKPMQNYVRQSRGRWRRAATLKWCGKCGMQMKENGRAWASRITVNENFVPETRRRGRCCCHLGTKIKLTCDVACRQNE